MTSESDSDADQVLMCILFTLIFYFSVILNDVNFMVWLIPSETTAKVPVLRFQVSLGSCDSHSHPCPCSLRMEKTSSPVTLS